MIASVAFSANELAKAYELFSRENVDEKLDLQVSQCVDHLIAYCHLSRTKHIKRVCAFIIKIQIQSDVRFM